MERTPPAVHREAIAVGDQAISAQPNKVAHVGRVTRRLMARGPSSSDGAWGVEVTDTNQELKGDRMVGMDSSRVACDNCNSALVAWMDASDCLGAWYSCEECDALIECGDERGLAGRAVAVHERDPRIQLSPTTRLGASTHIGAAESLLGWPRAGTMGALAPTSREFYIRRLALADEQQLDSTMKRLALMSYEGRGSADTRIRRLEGGTLVLEVRVSRPDGMMIRELDRVLEPLGSQR